ncbi:hypothetical protein QQG55_54725 [Brugia pahangi]|uniref:Ovule protein n=1 Tax=Brugia pahangi TaxID=6280 RepID=A0A0N4T1Z8_BRUPA|nr:unnamed protein product [Brugia pahangi]
MAATILATCAFQPPIYQPWKNQSTVLLNRPNRTSASTSTTSTYYTSTYFKTVPLQLKLLPQQPPISHML